VGVSTNFVQVTVIRLGVKISRIPGKPDELQLCLAEASQQMMLALSCLLGVSCPSFF
jgi:hypothetical protein